VVVEACPGRRRGGVVSSSLGGVAWLTVLSGVLCRSWDEGRAVAGAELGPVCGEGGAGGLLSGGGE